MNMIKVRTRDDIIGILRDFKPDDRQKQPESIVSTTFKVDNEEIKLSVNTVSKSKRQIILDGLDHIRQLIEAKKNNTDFKLDNLIDMRHPVDDEIKTLLDAERVGLNIVWNLKSGYYVYNIYDHSLMREDNAT